MAEHETHPGGEHDQASQERERLESGEQERPEGHPAHDHERSDVPTKGILKFAAVLVAFIIAVHVIILGILALVTAQAEGPEGEPTTLVIKKGYKLPRDLDKIPAPVLQSEEATDLEALRREEEIKLKEYRWLDRAKGVVQIPVDEAINILADPKKAAARGVRWREAKQGENRATR
jgi:hypothetical protein